MNLPIDLKNAICENKLIIFVGAGLSFNLTNAQGKKLKGWNNLVENVLRHLDQSGYDGANLLLPLVNNFNPIDILNLIESKKKFSKEEIYDFLGEFLDIENDHNDFTIHRKIADLCNKIITTNYDTAFEYSSSISRRNVAYKGKNYELNKHKNTHSKLLFKLHGCFENSGSMVLFPSNYENLYNNHGNRDAEHSLMVLRSIVVNNSLLFIGTGMGDFQINNIFKEIKHLQGEYNQKHFIITNKQLDSSLDFLTPIPINNYDEIGDVLDELLSHKANCTGESDSDKIKELEEELKRSNARIKELEKKASSDMDDLLEEEALKYFSKGLQHSIDKEYELAFPEFERSTQLKPNFDGAYYSWGTSLGNLAAISDGDEVEKFYHLAFEKLQRATEINPNYNDALYNWGTYLARFSRVKNTIDAEKHLRNSFDKFDKATKINQNDDKAFYNWANALGDLARMKIGEEAEALIMEAIEKYRYAIIANPQKAEAYYNWGTDLGYLANKKQGDDLEHLYREAFDKYDRATQINPQYEKAYYNWGNDLSNLAQNKSGKEAEDLLYQSFEKFEKVIEINPHNEKAYDNWAISLSDLAGYKESDEKMDLLHKAFEKYEKATQVNPDYYKAFFDWGNDLGQMALSGDEDEYEKFILQSFEKYERATEINPQFENAYYNWGLRLGHLATLKSGAEAEELFEEAFDKYKEVIRINRKNDTAFYYWGLDLSELAKGQKPKEAEKSLNQAIEKYEEAIRINPENLNALYNCGTILGNLAKTKNGKTAENLFERAIEKLTISATLGGRVYNLACFHALTNNKQEALKFLEKSLENDEETADYVLEDDDWKSYLNDNDFLKLIEKFKE